MSLCGYRGSAFKFPCAPLIAQSLCKPQRINNPSRQFPQNKKATKTDRYKQPVPTSLLRKIHMFLPQTASPAPAGNEHIPAPSVPTQHKQSVTKTTEASCNAQAAHHKHLRNRSTASCVASRLANAVRRNQPSPMVPNPEPGVPTMPSFSNK